MNTMNNNIDKLCDSCGCVGEHLHVAIVDGERKLLCHDCIERLGLVQCNECGIWYEPYEGIFRPDGRTWVCDDCASENWVICRDCGDYIRRDDAIVVDGDYYCDYCYDNNFRTCEICGTVFRYGEYVDGTGYVCNDCYNELSRYFHDYGYKPEPDFYRTAKDASDCLMFGVETELDEGEGAFTTSHDLCTCGAPVYCKHDGSLGEYGIEVVSHPCSLDYHQSSFGWADLYRIAGSHDYSATGTCGLHIHVGRAQLGDNGAKRDRTAGNIVLVVNSIWDKLVAFSRRDEYQIEDWCNRPNIEYDYHDSLTRAALATCDDGRYQAVNLRNSGTVEFRIFAGSDDAITTLAAIQLVNSIVKYAMTHSPEECDSVKWETIRDYITYPEMSKYLDYIGM